MSVTLELNRSTLARFAGALNHKEARQDGVRGRIGNLCVCLALLAILTACGKSKPKEEAAETEAPAPVLVEPAVRGAIDHMVIADAVLYPINQANVTPKIIAPVKRFLVNRGDHVKAGQLLAELEGADLASAVN